MDLQDFLILGKHDPRNTHATLFKAKDHLFCCFSDDECFFDVYIQYLHLVPKRQKRCMGKKRNQREFIPPLFSMTLSKKKWRYEYLHKEEFWMIFRSIFGQSRSSQKKKSVKKVRIFWISEFRGGRPCFDQKTRFFF